LPAGAATVHVSSGNAPGCPRVRGGVIFPSLMTVHRAYGPRDGHPASDGECTRCTGRGWVVIGSDTGIPEWRPCALCSDSTAGDGVERSSAEASGKGPTFG